MRNVPAMGGNKIARTARKMSPHVDILRDLLVVWPRLKSGVRMLVEALR